MHAVCVREKVGSSAHHSYGRLAHLINDLMCVCFIIIKSRKEPGYSVIYYNVPLDFVPFFMNYVKDDE